MSKQRAIAAEGRAIAARPSLCLLLLLAGTAALLSAPAAQAGQLPELTLTKTKPHTTEETPANWTTPLVQGRNEGGIVSSIQPPRDAAFPRTAAGGGGGGEEVILYTDPGCTTEIGTGELAELEGEGIEVEVPENSVTTFYAIQTDPAELEAPSDCSKTGITYWESSSGETPEEIEEREEQEQKEQEEGPGGGEPPVDERPTTGGGSGSPPAAPHIHMLPGARANDNTPQVTGSAPGAATVKVYANSKCSGGPVATGSASDLGNGIAVQVADNTSNSFSAVSVSSGGTSPCSDPASYVEDSTPPKTKITMGPGFKTRHGKVVFRFADITDDPPGTTFLCKFDRRKWRRCYSPFKVKHLHRMRRRGHLFRVRAIDVAGNAEAKAAKRRFKVVRGGR
jgi:hypothetical protein